MDIESCFWVITVIVMLMVMPNLEKLVLDKGQITLPSDLESVIGTELLNDIQNEGKDTYSFVYVFHQDKGLTAADYSAIEGVLHHLNTKSFISQMRSSIQIVSRRQIN